MKTSINLNPHQAEAVDKLESGKILWGDVGSGKSITSLYFYNKNYSDLPLLIITTPKKRDDGEWLDECNKFNLKKNIIIDSWNNIKKYKNIKNYFIIFDEDHLSGYGAWSKAFIRMAHCNKWIVLTGTPGDKYMDYMTVFIAKGWYLNKQDFCKKHVVYNPYTKYPSIDRYINTGILNKHRHDILVKMFVQKPAIVIKDTLVNDYDKNKYNIVINDKKDPFTGKPFKNISALCYCLRKISNIDQSKLILLRELILKHNKVIIFYNFIYEKELIKELLKPMKDFEVGEYNGQVHDTIPDGSKWVYLCQYTSAAEGWNCLTCDTMIFFSLNYSYKTMAQAEGRINRINTKAKYLYYYYLRSNSNIDIAIQRTLNKKKKFNESAFIGG